MRRIGQRLHDGLPIDWRDDRLPELSQIFESGERFDLIMLGAVWMHVAPEDRPDALRSIASLLANNGRLYLSLRLGPEEPERGV